MFARHVSPVLLSWQPLLVLARPVPVPWSIKMGLERPHARRQTQVMRWISLITMDRQHAVLVIIVLIRRPLARFALLELGTMLLMVPPVLARPAQLVKSAQPKLIQVVRLARVDHSRILPVYQTHWMWQKPSVYHVVLVKRRMPVRLDVTHVRKDGTVRRTRPKTLSDSPIMASASCVDRMPIHQLSHLWPRSVLLTALASPASLVREPMSPRRIVLVSNVCRIHARKVNSFHRLV